FCMTWMSKAPKILDLCGGQEGVRLLRAAEDGVKAIGAFCAEHGIDAQFRQSGWVWTASSRAQMDAWEDTVERLAGVGLHPFEPLDASEAARRTGTDANLGGVFEAGVATVQPALLARGLRRVALEVGVRIHEGTGVRDIEHGPEPVVVTGGGRVRAKTVVMALNAYAHEWPQFRRSVLAIASDVGITRPVADRLAELGVAEGLAWSDSRMMVAYLRTTVEGRLLIGKGGGPAPFAGHVRTYDRPTPRGGLLAEELRRFYPSLARDGYEHLWMGPVARTATGVPSVGRLPDCPAVIYGHGYVGNGVGPSYTVAKLLASMAAGLVDEWSTSSLVSTNRDFLPPEPLRYFGGLVVRRACARKDALDDAGRPAGPLTSALVALAPAGLTPVQKP
ncbi:MAG: FAD-dependent oxidoreductase, partial [Planctomycetes bacterium]|nr:FAD-dependent oxidoreductase [Planctomycetota bacterium]